MKMEKSVIARWEKWVQARNAMYKRGAVEKATGDARAGIFIPQEKRKPWI